MKKVLQVLSAALLGIGLMAGVASAAADTSCSIQNGNGTGSTNICTTEDNTVVVANCENNIEVDSGNRQIVASGTADSSTNNSVGTVTTGNAVNSNGQTVTLGASCGAAPAPVTTPATVTTPAGGAGAAAQAAPKPAPVAVKTLPHTGSNTVVDAAVAGVAGVAGVLAVAQAGSLAYRRLALK